MVSTDLDAFIFQVLHDLSFPFLQSIDSPQALVQMGGVALLVLFFCLRSKKILGK